MRLASTVLTTLLALTGTVSTSPIITHLDHDLINTPSVSPQKSIDKRQLQILVDIASILNIIREIVNLISDIEELENQHARESNFTQSTVSQLRNAYPTMNVIVYHNQGSLTNFHGGNHTHYELKIGEVPIIGTDLTQGYEVWVLDHGTFHRKGDGGFVNWCYDGEFDADGPDVTFYSMNGERKA